MRKLFGKLGAAAFFILFLPAIMWGIPWAYHAANYAYATLKHHMVAGTFVAHAQEFESNGDLQSAIDAYREALAASPDDFQIMYQLANAYSKSAKPVAAAFYFRLYLGQNDSSGVFSLFEGARYAAARGLFDSYLEDFREKGATLITESWNAYNELPAAATSDTDVSYVAPLWGIQFDPIPLMRVRGAPVGDDAYRYSFLCLSVEDAAACPRFRNLIDVDGVRGSDVVRSDLVKGSDGNYWCCQYQLFDPELQDPAATAASIASGDPVQAPGRWAILGVKLVFVSSSLSLAWPQDHAECGYCNHFFR